MEHEMTNKEIAVEITLVAMEKGQGIGNNIADEKKWAENIMEFFDVIFHHLETLDSEKLSSVESGEIAF